MKLYAIGDLHLDGGQNKPMDMFGPGWEGHWEKIQENWLARVLPEDIVLLPGDITWAMKLEEAAADLAEIGRLPGRKIMLRGNHDYWWAAISRVRGLLPAGFYALQNDAMLLDDVVFCGTRGWTIPGAKPDAEDKKLYARELERLKLSLAAAQKLAAGGQPIVALLHYPPFLNDKKPTEVTRLIAEAGVCAAVYGHLHNTPEQPPETWAEGVCYHLTSCDYLKNRLKEIPLFAE